MLIMLPTVSQGTADDGRHLWKFFTVHIRNRHTRNAYYTAVARFSTRCEGKGLYQMVRIEPVHVAPMSRS